MIRVWKMRRPTRYEELTIQVQVLRGTAYVQLTHKNGHWWARCPNLNLERSHKTQAGAVSLLKTAIEGCMAGQFALPLIDHHME